jgi:hypothetical protein
MSFVDDSIATAIAWALRCWPHLGADTKRAYPAVDAENALRELYARYSSEQLGRRADIELPTRFRPVWRALHEVLELLRANAEIGRIHMCSLSGTPVSVRDFEGGQIGTEPPGRLFLFRRRGSPIEIGGIVDTAMPLPPLTHVVYRRGRPSPPKLSLSATLKQHVRSYHDECDMFGVRPSITGLAKKLGLPRRWIQEVWINAGYKIPPHGGSRRRN